jgi:hypothetical protein
MGTTREKGETTMKRLGILGVTSLALAMLASVALAQRGGAARGGMRGAVAGGMVGGSEGAEKGAKVGVVTGATRKAIELGYLALRNLIVG